MTYPQLYHDTMAALVRQDGRFPTTIRLARLKLARLIKEYRRTKRKHETKDLIYHCSFVGWPIRKRPNGKWA